jgi:hypothetical protein
LFEERSRQVLPGRTLDAQRFKVASFGSGYEGFDVPGLEAAIEQA